MALGKRLLDAAIEGMGDKPMPSRKPSLAEEEDEGEYSPDAEHKAAFLEMCEAIRSGDDEAAWEAYQTCKELG